MKLIRPSYEIIEQGPGLQGIYDIIEKCGKVSYKSEAKGGETAKRFVEARTKEGHGAVLEFGTVYLQKDVNYDDRCYWEEMKWSEFYKDNPHSKIVYRLQTKYWVVKKTGEPVSTAFTRCYITTNYRVLVENNRLDDLKYLCEPTEYHEKRYTVKFITDIGLGRDFLRHRVMSPIQESTRYVNYTKEKNGGGITYILPPWIDLPEGEVADLNGFEGDVRAWLMPLHFCERSYTELIRDFGWSAEKARLVLPLATKTELALCGFPDAWVHFFCLRSDIASTGKAHPESEELANPLRDEFIERGYLATEDLKHDTMGMFDVAISDQNLKG